MFPHGASAGALGSAGWAVLGGAFLVLFALKASLALRPDGPFTRALYPWLFAGLYLDEWFTRFTFRVWPPRLDRATPVGALHVRDAVEA
jgi:NAD(P)H-quinone oxidoreductase subunit 5